MISGQGFEVEAILDDGKRVWVPVQFFATNVVADRSGNVGIALATFAIIGDRMRLMVTDRIRPTPS